MICRACDAWDGMVDTNSAITKFKSFGLPICYNERGNLIVPV